MNVKRKPARSVRTAIVVAAAMLAGAGAGGPAGAAEDLDKEMNVVAMGIKQLLAGRDQDAIAVGEFTGPARANSSGGSGIKLSLMEQLKKQNVRISRRAELEVKGDYLDVVDASTKMIALQLKTRIIDRSGTEITHFDRALFNVTTIASLIGLTGELPTKASDEVRNEKLADAIDNPQVHLNSTRISAGTSSPYAIEIVVKAGTQNRPRAATKDDDGFASLRIHRDEIYAVKLINDSPHDAAVTLTIDGLSVFAFSANKGYTHYIVPARQSLVVPGWHRTNLSSDSFKVTEYAKSAAAEALSNSADIGTITASFAAAWPSNQNPPADEGTAGTRAGDATGKGPPVEFKLQEVLRNVGRVRASVSVRYTKDVDPKDLPK